MFDLSLAELLLIVVVAVIFIGPKELPVVIRAVAKAMRSMRSLAHEVKLAFDDLSRESGIKEVADDLNQEMRMIEGDDGKMYEAYDVSTVVPMKESHHD